MLYFNCHDMKWKDLLEQVTKLKNKLRKEDIAKIDETYIKNKKNVY